jgi:YesN/AraC family two-component response regulator
MIQNYNQPITLKSLADYLQISPSYLGNIFKSITGKSVINYLIHIRINKAKHFLKDGLTVSETARKVGFNDVFYFSRAFKKYEGITPSQFIKTTT